MLLLASVLPWLAGRLSAAVLAALGGGAPGPLGRVFRRFSGPLPALLVTSNMGTLFEQPDKLVGAWITAFAQELRRRPDARFVAIHIQELGGKDWAVGMASVDAFIEQLRAQPECMYFGRALVLLDTQHDRGDSFTALGSIYLVHDEVAEAEVLDVASGRFQPLVGTVVARDLNDCFLAEKQRFADSVYPWKAWTRKGFVHVRFRLDGRELDLVNVHIFHDYCNIEALQETPSKFAECRRSCVDYVAQRCTEASRPAFVFGDFNFRLTLSGVVQHVARQGAANKRTRFDGESLTKLALAADSGGDAVLDIASSRFAYRHAPALLTAQGAAPFRNFDEEPARLESLSEVPVTFEPTYPYSEDADRPAAFLEKRCPAWTDRVLMNAAARRRIAASTTPATYDLFGRGVCVGDHKPVFLYCQV